MLDSVISGASMLKSTTKLCLPKSWPAKVCAAMLHVVSLAKYAAVYTRSWAADSPNARVRWRSERDREQEDAALLREEMRIKDARQKMPAPSATSTSRLHGTGSSTNAERQYVWSPMYVDALICRDRDTDGNGTMDERLYVQQDANWNVTAVISTSGSVQER